MSDNKTIREFRRIFGIPESISEFIEKYYNNTIDELNSQFKLISLSKNFDSQVFRDILIEAGETATISHRLNVVPGMRLIVRQSGNSLITDGEFTNKTVQLINNGANDVTLTVVLLKE